MKKIILLCLVSLAFFKVSFSQNDDDGRIFTIVEEMPKFPGGDSALKKFLLNHIRYPALARENRITGIVFVTFVINTEGKVTDPRLLKGIGYGCDEEALRVVSQIPDWMPGKQNGKNVAVQFNLPIKFNPEVSYSRKLIVEGRSTGINTQKYYDKGVQFAAEKEYGKAIESFTKVLEDTRDMDSYYNRGVCYKKLGNDSAACSDWQKAKELGDNESEKLLIKYCNNAEKMQSDSTMQHH